MEDNVIKIGKKEFVSENALAITAGGIVSLAIGVLGLLGGAYTGLLAMEALGVMLIIAGGFQFFQLFRRTSWENRIASIILSALYVLAGLFIMATPEASAAATTYLMGFLFIASGITKLVMTAEIGPNLGVGWMYLSASLSILLGAMVVSSWPNGAIEFLGFMVSLELISAGVTYINIGAAVKETEQQIYQATAKTQRIDKKVA